MILLNFVSVPSILPFIILLKKFGGNGEKGELGEQHGFEVAVAAENILNLYHYSNNIDRLSTSYEDFFLKLSDDIATFAITIPSNSYIF